MPERHFAIRPARDDDRGQLATLFAAVAEERDGIAAEPPVDVARRASRSGVRARRDHRGHGRRGCHRRNLDRRPFFGFG
jgi:hypothetical protein